jgi:hypothetical protein
MAKVPSPVILSVVWATQSVAHTESKDPYIARILRDLRRRAPRAQPNVREME